MWKYAKTFINLINAADSCHRTFVRHRSNDVPQAHLNKLWKETNPFRNTNIYKAEVFIDDISRYRGTSQKHFFFLTYDFHFFESPLTEVMKSFTKETV